MRYNRLFSSTQMIVWRHGVITRATGAKSVQSDGPAVFPKSGPLNASLRFRTSKHFFNERLFEWRQNIYRSRKSGTSGDPPSLRLRVIISSINPAPADCTHTRQKRIISRRALVQLVIIIDRPNGGGEGKTTVTNAFIDKLFFSSPSLESRTFRGIRPK